MRGREVFDRIPEEVCRELESIVGPEYVSADPVICQGNTGFGFGHEVYWFQGMIQPPSAIVMPKTTQEVARIVKLCNRYGIPFTPTSTHALSMSDPIFRQDVIMIDLQRMKKWEIDEKNMCFIAEPAVIAAMVSAEANKRGLYYIICGGGGVVSAASNQYQHGWGHFNYRATPYGYRRVNGTEWVSPEGDVYRLGSLSVGDDSWYWGEGVGMNFNGVLNGQTTWCGSMGIVTKVSFKLYPFQPEPLEPEGIGPDTAVALPPRVRYYNITFTSHESMLKAIEEIAEADIANIVNVVPPFWRAMSKCRGDREFKADFWEAWNATAPEEATQVNILRVLLIGRTSLKQLEYEERVLMDIVGECGGTVRRTRQSDEATFRYANTPDMWMMTGVFAGTNAGWEGVECVRAQNELFRDRLGALPFKNDWLDQKKTMPWFLMWDRGRTRYTELHCQPDARQIDPEDPGFNPGVVQGLVPWAVSEGPYVCIKTGCTDAFAGLVGSITEVSPAYHHYADWLRTFKKEFDPKGVSGTAWPNQIDAILQQMPMALTEESRQIIKQAEAGPWLGNPE